MLAPYIEWTDSVGLARLTSLVPTLSGWTPDVEKIGPAAVALGTGTTYQFTFRTDYPVRFVLANISPLQVPEMIRLKAYLLAGGSITVFTGDLAARLYTCKLRPGTIPEVSQDPDNLEFALTLALINTSAAPLVAAWQGAAVLLTPDTDYAAIGGTFTRATTATYYSGP